MKISALLWLVPTVVFSLVANLQQLVEFNKKTINIDDKTGETGSFQVRIRNDFPWNLYDFVTVSFEASLLVFDKCSLMFNSSNAGTYQTVQVKGSLFYYDKSEDVIDIPIKARVLSEAGCINVTEVGLTVTRKLVPSAMCAAWGDPHYTTFNGQCYTNMGEGDYILAQTANLIVQSRQIPIKPKITVVSAVAFKYLSFIYLIQRKTNKNELELVKLHTSSNEAEGLSVFKSNSQDVIEIYFSDESRLKVKLGGGIALNVEILISGSHYGRTDGLCGNYNGVLIKDIEKYYEANADSLYKIKKDSESIFISGRDASLPNLGGTRSGDVFGKCILSAILKPGTCPPVKSTTTQKTTTKTTTTSAITTGSATTTVVSSATSAITTGSATSKTTTGSATSAITTGVSSATSKPTTGVSSATSKPTTGVSSATSKPITVSTMTSKSTTKPLATTTQDEVYVWKGLAVQSNADENQAAEVVLSKPQFNAQRINKYVPVNTREMSSVTVPRLSSNPSNFQSWNVSLSESSARVICSGIINSTLCQALTKEQDKFIETCVRDAMESQSLDFIEASRFSFMASCGLQIDSVTELKEVAKHPEFEEIVIKASMLYGFGLQSCPKECSGHGRCEDSGCTCSFGFTGHDCSLSLQSLSQEVKYQDVNSNVNITSESGSLNSYILTILISFIINFILIG